MERDRRPLLARNSAAFEGITFNLPMQFAHAPAFGHALPGVETAGGLGFERQQPQEVGPAQLSHQRCDNFGVGESLGELHHAPQIFGLETTDELLRQAFAEAVHNWVPYCARSPPPLGAGADGS